MGDVPSAASLQKALKGASKKPVELTTKEVLPPEEELAKPAKPKISKKRAATSLLGMQLRPVRTYCEAVIAEEIGSDVKVAPDAYAAFRDVIEAMVVSKLKTAALLSRHREHEAVDGADFELMKQLKL